MAGYEPGKFCGYDSFKNTSHQTNFAKRKKTLISEGIDANYFDSINYAAFALILSQKINA